MKKPVYLLMFLIVAAANSFLVAAETNSVSAAESAYLHTLTQRVDKIVAPLGLADTEKATRVRDIIVRQYRDLAAIHEVRDQQILVAKTKAGSDGAFPASAIQAARDEAQRQLDELHGKYLAKLSRELSAEQVEQVKDGMTYGVVNGTYNVYLKMYPNLAPAQKKQIKDWLIEAREIAMDQGTSNEKHAVFGKYKGRINNYLVKAGYDLKAGEANLRKSPPTTSDHQEK